MCIRDRFSDVAGVDEAVEEMQEIKDFLANPAKYQSMGAKIPREMCIRDRCSRSTCSLIRITSRRSRWWSASRASLTGATDERLRYSSVVER